MKHTRVIRRADGTPYVPVYRRPWFWCVAAVLALAVGVNAARFLSSDRTLRWQSVQGEITYQGGAWLLGTAGTGSESTALVLAPLSEGRSAADIESGDAVDEAAGDWLLKEVPAEAVWCAYLERFLYGSGEKLYSCTPDGADQQLMWTASSGNSVSCTALVGNCAVLSYGQSPSTAQQLYTLYGRAVLDLDTGTAAELESVSQDRGQIWLAADGGWLYYYESDVSVTAYNGEAAYRDCAICRASVETGAIERLAAWEALVLDEGWDADTEERTDTFRPSGSNTGDVRDGCLYYTGEGGQLLCLPLDGSGAVREA